MKRYLYNYQTIVTFSEPVTQHAVMLRCQPANNAFQTVEQEHVVASPDYWVLASMLSATASCLAVPMSHIPHSPISVRAS